MDEQAKQPVEVVPTEASAVVAEPVSTEAIPAETVTEPVPI